MPSWGSGGPALGIAARCRTATLCGNVSQGGSILLRLINDILDLSKIESGCFELERVEFNLKNVIARCMELVSPKTSAKGVKLLSRIAPDAPAALIGDPVRLQQTLLNLLGNAAKFTAEGEIVLAVVCHPSGEPGRIDFSVSDTGIGIPAEKLGVIFDDFTQADSSTTRKYGGSGLGLGIARRLAGLMGGELQVRTALAAGSTFSFTAMFDLVRGSASIPADPLASFAGRRALVIDGCPGDRWIFREAVQSWGR